MAIVTCPQCGSEDLQRDDERAAGGAVAVSCLACNHRFIREPALACRRCLSGNVASRGYEGWAYDDAEAAREDPSGGSWSSYDREEFRCLDCNFTWRTSGPAAHSLADSDKLITFSREMVAWHGVS